MLLRKSFSAETRRCWFPWYGCRAKVLDNLKLGSSWALLCFITLLSLGTPRTYAGGFITAPTYPAGTVPQGVAVGDFNGDGILDLAVANWNPDPYVKRDTVSILLGNGDGSFRAPQGYVVGLTAYSVAVGDFNGDGNLDLVVTGWDGNRDDSVSVLLGNGDGTFRLAQTNVLDFAPTDLVVGDFNGDRVLDLAMTDFRHNAVIILLGNGDGTFHSNGISYAVGAEPRSLAVGDFNGDGSLDLAVASDLAGVNVLLGNGDGTFQPAQSYAAGPARAMAVADFNGDGILDLLVAGSGNWPGSVSVLLGNGDGTFQPPQTSVTEVGFPLAFLAVGDFNGDGHLDVVVGGVSVVMVLLGNGDGSFQAPGVYAVGNGYHTQVAVGDFNGDGMLDIAAANESAGTVTILLGKGDGTFQAAPCHPQGGLSMAVGDFNGDAIPDLAVTNLATGSVNILLGKGDGTFAVGQSYHAGYQNMAVGDFNGDGILDLVGVNGRAWGGGGTLSVMLGNGDGTFQTALTRNAGDGPNSVAIGDFNGDGKLDVVTTNFALDGDPRNPHTKIIENGVRVFLGNGDGTFQAGQKYPVGPRGSKPWFVAAADLNRDGRLDLVVANLETGTLSILLGNSDGTFQPARNLDGVGPYAESVVVGDFNGDGIPDLAVAVAGNTTGTVKVLLGNGDGTFQDAQAYAVAPSPYGVATGDFNKDGIVDLAVVDISGVSILLGNGDGTFQAAHSYAAGPGGKLAVADLNNDGFPDLVLASYLPEPGVLTILLNAP